VSDDIHRRIWHTHVHGHPVMTHRAGTPTCRPPSPSCSGRVRHAAPGAGGGEHRMTHAAVGARRRSRGGAEVTVDHVCAVAAIGSDRAAVAVALRSAPRETLYASNQLASDLQELALALGEGPGIDALTDGPLVAELTATGALRRWPAFARPPPEREEMLGAFAAHKNEG